jgi:undecaprenyl diphosphate synthase
MTTTAGPFTSDQLHALDKTRVPHHVAIIPDGNRRWAKLQEEQIGAGHRAGGDNLIDIVLAGKAIGIKAMTFYLFSTENWDRSEEEVAALMWLLIEFLQENTAIMIEEGIRVSSIGNINRLPMESSDAIRAAEKATRHCTEIDMVIALNYGGRDEIVRAVKTMMEVFEQKGYLRDFVDEESIARYLDTNRWPDPELLIRTSGEMRISNFMLWQLSYSEIYFSPVLWPDFKPQNLLEAIIDYQKRERRMGGA